MGLSKWSPLSILYIVGLVGVLAVLGIGLYRSPSAVANAFTAGNITVFFTNVALVLTMLSPLIAKVVSMIVETRVSLTEKTAAQAHQTATEAAQAVNGPLSQATSEAIALGIRAYAATGDVGQAQTAALERMKNRELPAIASGPGSTAGGNRGG